MAAIFPYLLSFADGFVDRARRSAPAPRGSSQSRRPDLGGRPALERRRQVRPRHRPPRLRRQGPRHPGPRAARPAGDIPPTDFTIGIDEPDDRRRARRPGGRLPGAQDQVGGPQDLATLRAVREVFTGPIRVDANTGWTRDDAERLLPEIVDLGVELIEQPFPRPRLSRPRLAPGALVDPDRRRRERGHRRGPRRARRRRRRRQREARQVRRRSARPRRCSNARASSASGPSSAAWRRRRSGSPASAAVASLADWVDLDGCLLLADDPFEGLDLDADHRWILPRRPGLGLTLRGRLTARRARSARAFGERPFVWITWWTKWWTSPLHATARSGLRCAVHRSAEGPS